MRSAVAIVVLPFLAACGEAPDDDLALRVEYAGCRALVVGPHCTPAPHGRLALWVQAPPGAEIEIDAAGLRVQPAPPVAVQSGLQYALELAPGAAAVVVHARTATAAATWRLTLAQAADPLAAVRADFDAGELERARANLEQTLDSGSAELRGPALGWLARVALQQGRAEEAEAHLRSAMDIHSASGNDAAFVNDATLLAYVLIQQRRFSEARSVLDALAPDPAGPAENRYLTDYYRGMLALETGDARAALRRYEAAVAQAERAGRVALQRTAEDDLATQLQALGRRAEADALYAKLLRERPADIDDCEHARLLSNAAWNRLLAREADEPAEDPTPLLEDALALYERGCSDRPERQLNARLNLALAELHRGDPHAAEAQLTAVASERAVAGAGIMLWWQELEGRVALAEARPQDALGVYTKLAALAEAGAAPEARWRAAFGQAQALSALGRREDALAAFADAEALLDEESLLVPMQEGRETFAARRERATREHIALLLADADADEALAVARRSRSRALRALQRQDRLAQLSGAERARWDDAIAVYLAQRDALNDTAADDWNLPADELQALQSERATTRASLDRALDDAFSVLHRHAPPGAHTLPQPAPGELVLAYHPLPEGWVAFAHTAESTRAVTLSCVDAADGGQALASCLLEPFHDAIAVARQLRVLPYGVLRNVDFHALPFAGDVLLAVAPVVYGLDLPAAQETRVRTDRALVVADPRGNLPAARREAKLVAETLSAKGAWTPETLAGKAALGSELRRRLGTVDLFHYAGHAIFGGASGWDSVLPLAESSDLTLGDILALAQAPRWVVLSGCETARSGAATPAESLGLAQAFLAAGSASVLAAVRPVADHTAATLVGAFYGAWSETTPASAALRIAQLALRERDPAADWASFRIVEH